ncbi:hypothetical protein [Ferribacterium limneticum]|uniref:hypothetical protein n=1 Tax=Ferribacterium limneticum TaxID=76259 RepID=UPI001CF9F6BA|nr:hypothetical protein [Ferribacterium limneticum]UCV30055.1 hypothetical protein KI617_08285 [Ferribacterium limneticum]UCV33974.1 hypothetical protein KI608_08285 [Ferribacterium limneticum]
MSITAITSFYAAGATSAVRSAASSQGTASTAGTTSSESTTVSISNEARLAAAGENRIAVPESIRQDALAELNRVFPQDILDEAKARLEANQGISGSSSATPGLGNLPLLPENAALLAQIKSEMHAARAANKEGMTNLTPYVRLIQAVQSEGWKTPMSMEDAQREVDIAQAMAKLTPAASEAPLSEAQQLQKDQAAMAQFEKELAGEVPDKLKQRWQEAGLSMPESATTTFPQSIWLGLAKAAGIGEDEFLGKARELAGSYKGDSFLQEIEKFVSERYVASSGTTTST